MKKEFESPIQVKQISNSIYITDDRVLKCLRRVQSKLRKKQIEELEQTHIEKDFTALA